jgi:scyllo-inositol 2-dehydrogenase (NADP+)
VLDGDREAEREVPTRNGDYAGFYIALADAIQHGVKFPVSPQDAVDVMTIIELAARSSDEGTRLPFERIR